MVPMAIDIEFPDKLGIDRLLAAYAAWSLFGNSKALIVLQVGTAVTIDLVDKRGVYQGGVILPSETTLYSSLAEKTDLLPKIEVDASRFEIDLGPPGELLKVHRDQSIEEMRSVPAKNTVDAIKIGVSHCMRGGVEWTYQRYCRELGAMLPVVATGGGALQLHIDQMPMTVVSNLVLKGLSLLPA
jgi:type III pantothenate kinase